MEVTLTLHGIPGLPSSALESLDYRKVPIENNQIKESFEPFGVRGYLIEPQQGDDHP